MGTMYKEVSVSTLSSLFNCRVTVVPPVVPISTDGAENSIVGTDQGKLITNKIESADLEVKGTNPSSVAKTVSISTKKTRSVRTRSRESVIKSLEHSLSANAEVWTELSKH